MRSYQFRIHITKFHVIISIRRQFRWYDQRPNTDFTPLCSTPFCFCTRKQCLDVGAACCYCCCCWFFLLFSHFAYAVPFGVQTKPKWMSLRRGELQFNNSHERSHEKSAKHLSPRAILPNDLWVQTNTENFSLSHSFPSEKIYTWMLVLSPLPFNTLLR